MFICSKDYILEALDFHLLKSEQSVTTSKTVRNKPRSYIKQLSG